MARFFACLHPTFRCLQNSEDGEILDSYPGVEDYGPQPSPLRDWAGDFFFARFIGSPIEIGAFSHAG